MVRYWKWLFFTILLSILPLGLTAITLMNHNKFTSLSDCYSHGELLLIGVGLVGSTLGELFGNLKSHLSATIIVGAVCFILGVMNSAWFADISASLLLREDYNIGLVTEGSPWLFLFCLISSLCGQILSSTKGGGV
ncbi:MAG: hypothetical protein LV480_06025 [Methylacidiphilales bacterium]|nr:hypothetical protein [Candidatus Methylacidiphilales bacterium]